MFFRAKVDSVTLVFKDAAHQYRWKIRLTSKLIENFLAMTQKSPQISTKSAYPKIS